MSFNMGPIKPSTRWSAGAQSTWGSYWDAMFPPRDIPAWIDWKRSTTGVNIARRYWNERETLRLAYESVHGTDPDAWPSRHPGVVLSDVPVGGYAACLGCQWFAGGGLPRARRHETSNGAES